MKIENDREREQTGRVGSPLCDTVCACEEESFVQSGQLRPCDNARGGGGVGGQQAEFDGSRPC